MKKNAVFAVMLLCMAAIGQERPAVVVGAVGDDPRPGLRRALETQIKAAFVRDGRFAAVTRDEAALAAIAAEHVYQREGAVDDGQIRQLGKQTGARYVCVVEISPLMNSYMLSAQFADIESANIVAMASVPSALVNSGDFLAASDALVRRLLGARAADGAGSGYGSGVFFEENRSVNPLSEQLFRILLQKVAVSNGTCISGITVAIEGPAEPACSEGMVGSVCRADVTLVITNCRGGQRTTLRGAVVGSDRTNAEAARRQFERSMATAGFWNEWVREIERRGNR